MKILISIIKSFLFLSLVIYSCNPDAEESTKRINEDHIESINEKEQKGEIIWINETQGFLLIFGIAKNIKLLKSELKPGWRKILHTSLIVVIFGLMKTTSIT